MGLTGHVTGNVIIIAGLADCPVPLLVAMNENRCEDPIEADTEAPLPQAALKLTFLLANVVPKFPITNWLCTLPGI
jgi:hypothetical protein